MTLDASYRICWTIESWLEALRMALDSPRMGLDFETCPDPRREFNNTALRPELGGKIAGVAMAWTDSQDQYQSAYVGIRHHRLTAGGVQLRPWQVIESLDEMIAKRSDDQLVVVANAAMELQYMLAEGIRWPRRGQIHDIQVATRVLNKGVGFKEQIGLKLLQAEYLKKDMKSKQVMDEWLRSRRMKPGRDIWKAPVALAGWYAQDDARDTLHIWRDWESLVYQKPTGWWWHRPPDKRQRHDLYELEMEAAIHSVVNCLRGTRVDVHVASRRASAAKRLQDVCRDWIRFYLDLPTINPGSATQMRGILFGDTIGFKISLEHLTDAFKELPERMQVAALADHRVLLKYASLDIDALKHYGEAHPKYADLTFIMAVYRKCTTAITWFEATLTEFLRSNCPDPWWEDDDPVAWVHLIFHRLRTVGTVSGRMSSSDYNGQQVPKRIKMILAADKLIEILERFMGPIEFARLRETLDFDEVGDDDESKSVNLPLGGQIIDLSVRRMFIARPGHNMRTHDLSQVEMRGFANFSGNPLLCGGYGAPLPDSQISMELERLYAVVQGGRFDPRELDVERHVRAEAEETFDIHKFVADQLGIGRKPAKGINFGIVYGMGQKKLARSLGWSVDEGRRYLGDYHHKFPEIMQVQAAIKSRLRDRGYIFDPFGRRYYLPIARAYVGLNRLIQGWAASIFKAGYVRVCELFMTEQMGAGSVDPVIGRRLPEAAMVLSVIHDELLSELAKEYDTPEVDFMVRTCMTNFWDVKVPLGTSSERSERSWDETEGVTYQLGAA